MKIRTIIGAAAATALIGLGAYNYTQKNAQQTKPATEVEALRKQYVADSLDFVNSDSVKAKAKLSELKRIQREYIIGKHANDKLSEDSTNALCKKIIEYNQIAILFGGGDSKLAYMEDAISDAQRQIDIATANVLKATKEKLAQAELKEKQEKAEKERKDSIINEFDKVLAE